MRAGAPACRAVPSVHFELTHLVTTRLAAPPPSRVGRPSYTTLLWRPILRLGSECRTRHRGQMIRTVEGTCCGRSIWRPTKTGWVSRPKCRLVSVIRIVLLSGDPFLTQLGTSATTPRRRRPHFHAPTSLTQVAFQTCRWVTDHAVTNLDRRHTNLATGDGVFGHCLVDRMAIPW